jgi:hypothetical protein
MAERKVGNQVGSLILDHLKLGIDPISLCSGGVQHIVGKLSTRATTLRSEAKLTLNPKP